jgi:hypothetical protein
VHGKQPPETRRNDIDSRRLDQTTSIDLRKPVDDRRVNDVQQLPGDWAQIRGCNMRTTISPSARKILASAALLASTTVATPAIAAASFQADVGTWIALNPGYTEDQEYGAAFTVTPLVTLDDGTVLQFTGPVQIRTVPSSWSTWCCGYTGDVLYTQGATSVTIDALTGVAALGFYAEPNQFADYLITLMLEDGSSLVQTVNGSGGAEFFGFTGGGVTSMTVSSSTDFAIGDFFVRAVPEPQTWAMMLLGFGGIGMAMRRSKRATRLAQVA